MWNIFPLVGWVISFIISFSLAIPFFFIWNALAPIYFYFLPAVYLSIPFWHVVGLFMILPILKYMLIPTFSTSSSSSVKAK